MSLNLELLKKISSEKSFPPEPNKEPISISSIKQLVGGDAKSFMSEPKKETAPEPFFEQEISTPPTGIPGVYWTDDSDDVLTEDGISYVEKGCGDLFDSYCSQTAIDWWRNEATKTFE